MIAIPFIFIIILTVLTSLAWQSLFNVLVIGRRSLQDTLTARWATSISEPPEYQATHSLLPNWEESNTTLSQFGFYSDRA